MNMISGLMSAVSLDVYVERKRNQADVPPCHCKKPKGDKLGCGESCINRYPPTVVLTPRGVLPYLSLLESCFMNARRRAVHPKKSAQTKDFRKESIRRGWRYAVLVIWDMVFAPNTIYHKVRHVN
jgi:hypothetical protein